MLFHVNLGDLWRCQRARRRIQSTPAWDRLAGCFLYDVNGMEVGLFCGSGAAKERRMDRRSEGWSGRCGARERRRYQPLPARVAASSPA
jgi:hypothetical protein